MKIYVASSWRNACQPEIVAALRAQGHDVYDFRNPMPGNHGFRWLEIDCKWQEWTPAEFRNALDHPVAREGYQTDMAALTSCDACVLVMPSGRSAHFEAGFAIGAGKPTAILLSDGEPELMYRMAHICLTLDEVIDFINNCCHYECRGGWNVALNDSCIHINKQQEGEADEQTR